MLILCALSSVFLFDLSRVSSNAMKPALNQGDLVLSWNPKGIPVKTEPGDVVLVTHKPDEANRTALYPNFLRCIANNGEEISYARDKIFVGGQLLSRLLLTSSAIWRAPDEPEIWRETLPNGRQFRILLPKLWIGGLDFGRLKLKQGESFLAGDNRTASYDSRQTGPFEEDSIRGKALFIVQSAHDDGIIGHWGKLLSE